MSDFMRNAVLLALDHGWQFRQVSSAAGAEQGENGWLPATVPGDVHLDLLANKKIPDPFFATTKPSCNGSRRRAGSTG
jgi:beta-mannosidase